MCARAACATGLDTLRQKAAHPSRGQSGAGYLRLLTLHLCAVHSPLSPEFVEEVAEWLSGADFTLFFAGSTYGLVRTSVVESWPRVTSKRLSADLLKVAQGSFDFSKLERLLPVPKQEQRETGETE
jgi:hypothetical protein